MLRIALSWTEFCIRKLFGSKTESFGNVINQSEVCWIGFPLGDTDSTLTVERHVTMTDKSFVVLRISVLLINGLKREEFRT